VSLETTELIVGAGAWELGKDERVHCSITVAAGAPPGVLLVRTTTVPFVPPKLPMAMATLDKVNVPLGVNEPAIHRVTPGPQAELFGPLTQEPLEEKL
jgi:hypothetical protein